MLIKNTKDDRPSEITPRHRFVNRRQFIGSAVMTGGGLLLANVSAAEEDALEFRRLENVMGSAYSTDEQPTSLEDIISYNNFYEFGLDKSDPVRYSGDFKPKPWQVSIGGASSTVMICTHAATSPHCDISDVHVRVIVDSASQSPGVTTSMKLTFNGSPGPGPSKPHTSNAMAIPGAHSSSVSVQLHVASSGHTISAHSGTPASTQLPLPSHSSGSQGSSAITHAVPCGS